MDSIPKEWVDKLFDCMDAFYGDRWKKYHEKPNMLDINKTMWRSALIGLSYEQIKQQLQRYKRAAQDPRVMPPHAVEFFRYAKTGADPVIDYHPSAGMKGDPVLAKEHLDNIKKKLHI